MTKSSMFAAVEFDRAVHQIVETASASAARGSGSRAAVRSRSRAAIVVGRQRDDRCGRIARRRSGPLRRRRAWLSASPACSSSNTRRPGRRAARPSRDSGRGAPTENTGRADRRRRGLRPSRARAIACRRGCPRPSRPTTARCRCLRCAARTCRRAAREQPVEERRASAADVQVAGRRRRESDARSQRRILPPRDLHGGARGLGRVRDRRRAHRDDGRIRHRGRGAVESGRRDGPDRRIAAADAVYLPDH